jgi:hypothetical protein
MFFRPSPEREASLLHSQDRVTGCIAIVGREKFKATLGTES